MAAGIHASSKRPIDLEFKPVLEADQTRDFARIYIAIREYMLRNPEKGFLDVNKLLKTNRAFTRLLAYQAPASVPERPEWPPGTPQKYHLYVAAKETAAQIKQKMKEFKLSSPEDNLKKLSECGFSSFWLRNNFRVIPPNNHPCAQLELALQKVVQIAASERAMSRKFPELKTPKMENFSDVWDQLPEERYIGEFRPCQVALSIIFTGKINQYCPAPASVLEVGSGYFPVVEYMAHLPREKVHLSDRSPRAVEYLKKNYPEQPASIYDVHKSDMEQTFHAVAMCDVMNTFSDTQIETAAKELYDKLEPGGYLLDFSIREMVFIHLVDEAEKNGYMYFPFFNAEDVWTGVYTAELNKVVERVEKLPVGQSMMQSALKVYIGMGTENRLGFYMDYCRAESNDLTQYKLLRDAFLTLKCPDAQLIFFNEEHYRNMGEILKNVGFKIVESGKQEKTCSGPRGLRHEGYSHANHFSAGGPTLKCEFDPAIPSGEVMERASVHVIVAQKPESFALPSQQLS